MTTRTKLSAATGGAALLVLSLLLLWANSNPAVSTTLARYGINLRFMEESGIPGTEALGLRRQLLGESHGAGTASLTSRRFLGRRGQVLILDCDVVVGRGFLRLSVNRGLLATGELWGRSLHADWRETIRIRLSETGIYRLTISQYGHAGSYRVEWSLEDH